LAKGRTGFESTIVTDWIVKNQNKPGAQARDRNQQSKITKRQKMRPIQIAIVSLFIVLATTPLTVFSQTTDEGTAKMTQVNNTKLLPASDPDNIDGKRRYQ
jgi:hypothetical protein